MNASLDLEEVLRRILVALESAFAFHHSMVLMPSEGALEVKACLGYPQTGIGARVGLNEGPVGVVARRKKLLRMGAMRNKVRYAQSVALGPAAPLPGLPEVDSVIIVPMLAGDELVGVLSVESPEPMAFDLEDERLVSTVANLAAAAIRNARLYQDLVETHRSGERFVPHEFVRFLEKRALKDLGRGECVNREMSVLFSDLRGFTSLVEGLDPESTFELLNGYFATMVPPIQAHRGFVDKFIGDAIMALFDDPGSDGALQAAVEEHRALDRLNAERAARGLSPLAMGIGLHFGPLTLGVVGSEERLSCTVYGDSVNLASRLESLTKAYGARVLLSGASVRALREPERFRLRRLDRVRVKGKAAAVDLYECLDALSDEEAGSRAPSEVLDLALQPWFAGDFPGASSGLAELRARHPLDPALAMLAERAQAYAKAPPGRWDGAVRLDQK